MGIYFLQLFGMVCKLPVALSEYRHAIHCISVIQPSLCYFSLRIS